MSALIDAPQADAAEIRSAMEYYARREWTDGLPVVPVTESYLAEFLASTSSGPDEVLFTMPHLNRRLTVRLAAINAAMAGCLPEYFPVVLAAWEAVAKEPYPKRGIWQSTTGTAPLLIVNGPVRGRIGLNSRGNVFGSGFRANATIGRAIRLTAINAFGLRPHQLDQATQATLGKYSACIAENEEESPWEPLHAEHGFDPSSSSVTAMVFRSCMHIEARHTGRPEQLALDLANSIRRTGSLIHEASSALAVLGPEHAALFGEAGWSKDDVRRFIFDNAVNSRAELAAVGKDALSRHTRWRLPAGHPDAIPDQASASDTPDRVPALKTPSSIEVMVAGANNAGVSTIIETFGMRGDTPSIAQVKDLDV
ncbi:hypothetical protein [Nonomuraea diastatica]|uniref:Thioredoxin n=1 Tax=Nonomuraea diastatica TaxID=1848329 RepID=A0A4R4VXU0_9ACTN|nr:hypothetical protein [Nonomuraea diastatica]TDD10969.1 hypothetical protein E1294_45800 [Nonomuraea diastatica]